MLISKKKTTRPPKKEEEKKKELQPLSHSKDLRQKAGKEKMRLQKWYVCKKKTQSPLLDCG